MKYIEGVFKLVFEDFYDHLNYN